MNVKQLTQAFKEAVADTMLILYEPCTLLFACNTFRHEHICVTVKPEAALFVKNILLLIMLFDSSMTG